MYGHIYRWKGGDPRCPVFGVGVGEDQEPGLDVHNASDKMRINLRERTREKEYLMDVIKKQRLDFAILLHS